MSNCWGSEVESQKLKVECPEKSEGLKRHQGPGIINHNPGHAASRGDRRKKLDSRSIVI